MYLYSKMCLLPKVVRAFFVNSIIVTAIALTPYLTVAKRPKPPQTGTPSGNTTPGATRPEANCPPNF